MRTDTGAPRSDPPPDPRIIDRQLARRVVGFDEAVMNAVATEVHRIPEGVVRLSRDVPLVFGLSGLQLDRPVAAVEMTTILDRHFTGLPARRVITTKSEVAWSVGHVLAEMNFTLQPLLYMVHDRTTPPAASPIGFRVTDAAGFSSYLHRSIADQPWGNPDVARAMDIRARRVEERAGGTFIVDSEDVAGCQIYQRGSIAQIEEVGVLTEARGQGLGIGVMMAALAACAEATTVFLVAVTDDWPRHWYTRLGFRAVASGWEWTLRDATS